MSFRTEKSRFNSQMQLEWAQFVPFRLVAAVGIKCFEFNSVKSEHTEMKHSVRFHFMRTSVCN